MLELALPEFVAPPPPAPAAPAAAKKSGQPAEQSNKAGKAPESKAPARDGAVVDERKKKEKKEKKPAAETTPAASDEPTVDFLDLRYVGVGFHWLVVYLSSSKVVVLLFGGFRVGKILDVKQHPNAESLYVETIDLGEETPRQASVVR